MHPLLTRLTISLAVLALAGVTVSGSGQKGGNNKPGHTGGSKPIVPPHKDNGIKGKDKDPKQNGKPGTNGGSKTPKLTPKQQHQHVQDYIINNSSKLSAQQKSALNNVATGAPLSAADRETISALLVNPPAPLSTEVREALSQALTEDMESQKTWQTRRYLKIHNNTSDTLQVYVQYRALNDKDEWNWYPSEPKLSKAYLVKIDAGKVINMTIDKQPVAASRARIWATSHSGSQWVEYREKDFWLVPEKNEKGQHGYYAVQMETDTFTFNP
jgi:hypothetical protein